MREAPFQRQRYQNILALVAAISALLGLLMLSPLALIVTMPIPSSVAGAFLLPALVLIFVGVAVWRCLKVDDLILTMQEGSVVVVLSWALACLLSAIPIALIEDLTLTQALFESVSGWTTTGLSVVDVARAHPTVLLWRSVVQLAGGAGFAVIALASISENSGASLSSAEGRTDYLAPNVRRSAKVVLTIYLGLALCGTVALQAAGMSAFDALNHAFAAISTGGFSTRQESIGFWNSSLIELIIIVLMIFGSLNFVTTWCLLRGQLWLAFKNGELRLISILIPLSAFMVFWLCCTGLYPDRIKSLRVALFESVSALTSCGFSTVGYSDWSSSGILILILLMLVGGGTCSTAGGIKQQRVYLLFTALILELKRAAGPRSAIYEDRLWLGEEQVLVSTEQLKRIGVFVFLYLLTWLCGSLVLTAHGHGIADSLFEFASTVGTTGLSIGLTSSKTPAVVLWTQIAGMLLGRLEFFVIFIALIKLLRDARTLLEANAPARTPSRRL